MLRRLGQTTLNFHYGGFARRNRVSPSWLHNQLVEETKQGWEGPSWRFPKERAAMAQTSNTDTSKEGN